MSVIDDSSTRGGKHHYFALPPGARLHEFEVESVLGHGGFGITYLALDTLLQEKVAIKEYLPSDLAVRTADTSVKAKSEGDRGSFESGLASFLEEARLLARLHHPNIMQVRRFFEMHGTGYIVARYEDGQTLSQRLAEDGPLPDGELRRILAGLLDGLEAVHNSAILHRDLKPSNVMLRGDGTPLLIDFGAARDFKARSSRSVTSIATRGYSPPEQYGVGGQQGPWTDIYALGGILYRCVTGQVPIDSLARLRNDPLVPAVQAARDRGYDPVLLRTIDWMLKVNEEDRPTSVAQLRIALADNRSDTVGIAPPPASSSGVVPPTAAATAQNERTSGSLLWLMIPILCLLPVLAFISWPLTTETDQTPPSAPVAAQTEPAPTSVAAVPQPTPEPTPKPVDPPDDPEQKLDDSGQAPNRKAIVADNRDAGPDGPKIANLEAPKQEQLDQPEALAKLANVALEGPDREKITDVDLATCDNHCQSSDNCAGFAYDKWNRWCFLKSEGTQLRFDPQYESAGRMVDRIPRSEKREVFWKRRNKFFPSAAYNTVGAAHYDECVSYCENDSQCIAINFSTQTGRCQLLDATPVAYELREGTEIAVRRQPSLQ